MRARRWLKDLGALFFLLLLPLILFWPVTLGGKTLIPADNLYQWQPYRSFAAELGVPTPPHNELLSDLVLENLVWKQSIVRSLRAGEVPLWNPDLFAGVPFLAAGQHSALYPPSLLFYILPLTKAYGLFTVLQLWMAGAFLYLFARVLRLQRLPALVAAVTYELSAFFLVSVVFTMIIAAAVWLPLLLAVTELIIRKQEEKGTGPFVPIVYVIPGALALGMVVLAGHAEILVYTLLVTAYYAVVRLALLGRRVSSLRPALRMAAWLVFMAGLGLGLGSVQLIPLLELVTRSFREGSVSYRDVIGWAYPTRQIVTFLVPNFFGNPSHHGYLDLVSRQWQEAGRLFWGIKNYVEAGSYVGILPLLLAVVAILQPLGRRGRSRTGKDESGWAETVGERGDPAPAGNGTDRRHVWIFAALAAASLLFIFGTPLYALLYYGLPGVKQLHSPFRWVFPYTLSVAILAGMGLQQLRPGRSGRQADGQEGGVGRSGSRDLRRRLVSGLGWAALASGLVLLAGLLALLLVPERFTPLADRLIGAMGVAQQVPGEGRGFLSYEWPNLVLFAILLTLGGGILLAGDRRVDLRRGRWKGRTVPVVQALAVLVVAGDLLVVGQGFNSAADPSWLKFRPPAIQFLADRAASGEPWRLTTYQVPSDTKTLNANIPWLHDLQDVRGYDSIIPRQYVQYMEAIERQGELLHNRIAPLYGAEHLSSPLLDLLNVRYVVTEGEIANPGYAPVYKGEVRIYENLDVLPRAFALPNGEAVAPDAIAARLAAFDPRQVVLLDAESLAEGENHAAAGSWPLQPATTAAYSPNVVFVDVEMPGPGWLVLADSFFPGWKAYRSDPSAEVTTAKTEPAGETELTIVRADGNFRAVWLEAGAHRVRFKYTPMSFKLGLYGSFLAVVVLFLSALYWLWGRLYRERSDDPVVKRVAKNSLLPMGLQLLNRVIDFAFAMMMLRILAPEMTGRFDFAVGFIGYFDILTRFGLGTLLTREVAKDRSQGNRYLSIVTILRAFLWVGSLPVMALALLLYQRIGRLTPDIVVAIAFFALGVFFSSLADGFSSIFYAHEKMEYPAAVSTVTALTRVSLGVLALLVGWGFVGLAAVSVIANVLSTILLGWLMVRHCLKPHLDWDPQRGRWMLGTSYPLMVNLFLATAFFRVDVLILKPLKGDAVVGYYGAAYRYLNGLNIIPAYFTQAIFPLMSRYAESARDSLMRAYVLSLRLLMMIAVPLTVGTALIARELILLLGGSTFLPHSQIALQLIIWFLPLSFVNSVTQYVLIAIDQQRFLTRAFLIGVGFNIVANLLLIPYFSYRGAAVVTVLSEVALLIPFYYSVRKHLGPLPWVSLFWRPVAAAAAMGVVMWLLREISWLVRIPVGVVVYGLVLLLVGGFRQPDMHLVGGLVRVDRLRARLRGGLRSNARP